MGEDMKKTEQVNVKLSPNDLAEINQFCQTAGLDITSGQALRMAWKFFNRAAKDNGVAGLLYKLLNEN